MVSQLFALTAGLVTVCGALLASPAHAATASGVAPEFPPSHAASTNDISVTGSDGRIRTITSAPSSQPVALEELYATVTLHDGDALEVASDGKSVVGVNREGKPFLTLSGPELKKRVDVSVDAKFVVDGNTVRLEPVTPVRSARAHACPESFWGNFLVAGVGGVVVCGSVGVATGGIGGAVCGLGVHAATSGINWDSACRRK